MLSAQTLKFLHRGRENVVGTPVRYSPFQSLEQRATASPTGTLADSLAAMPNLGDNTLTFAMASKGYPELYEKGLRMRG